MDDDAAESVAETESTWASARTPYGREQLQVTEFVNPADEPESVPEPEPRPRPQPKPLLQPATGRLPFASAELFEPRVKTRSRPLSKVSVGSELCL